MASYRCSTCGINFPQQREFRFCPHCKTRNDPMRRATAITIREARAIVARVEFEKYYNDREAIRVEHGQPTPEELGALEAFEINQKRKEETDGGKAET